ncbi:hypothetical protein [Herbaspirillum huttiense]|uniref:hypothetical protein n=1 Tax=Herbaspirillum huttiense TaxID=863372 RepID=UPI0031E174A1
MNKSQLFGLWKEHCGEGFPSLYAQTAAVLSPEDAAKVADYLASCPIWIASPGGVKSCIPDSDEFAGTLSIRTNGKWAWQDTMAYYVSRLRISPPVEFLKDIRNGDMEVPDEDAIDIASLEFPVF